MESLISNLVDSVAQMGVGIYFVVFFAAFSETVLGLGLIIPGSTIILAISALSTDEHISIWFIIILASLAAIIGDNINYFLGHRYGKKWISEDSWILTPTNYERGNRFFKSHGAKSVFFGRFVPAIKEIIPFIAGISNMDKRRFYLYNILGGIGWSLQWTGIGYFFGYSISTAQSWIHRIELIVVFLIISIILYYTTSKMLTKKNN